MGWILMWVALLLLILAFNYSASQNNEEYDLYMLQKEYFDTYVNNDSLVLVKYIGDDRCEIKRNQHTLITIDTVDNDKIRVRLDDIHIMYDDFKHFCCDWKFNDED